MKKKLLLLITLVVSLFIYSGRVNAVAMWMQCTQNADGKMKGNDDDYTGYNTFAVINEFNSSINIKRIAYFGGLGDNGIKQKNFLSSKYGPTFISNIGGVRGRNVSANQNICWYQSGFDDNCPENSGPFYSMNKFDEGVCPESIYEADGGNKTDGDFIILSGADTVYSENAEYLNGYEFALYKYNIGPDAWMMEAYNSSGVYGFTSVTPMKDIYNHGIKFNTFAGNGACSFGSDFSNLFCYYLDIKGKNGDSNDIIDNGTFDYDSTYVDWLQHAEMIKIYYTGKHYFQLSNAREYPQVLIANIGDYQDDSKKRSDDDSIHTYKKGATTWQEIKDWAKENSSGASTLGGVLKKFENGGKYFDLIETAEKVNDSLAKGKKYSLDSNIHYDQVISELNSALNDIQIIIPTTESDSRGIGFVKYRIANESELTSTDSSVKSKIINNCISDGSTSSAIDSAADYVGCKTFGYPFSYVIENDNGKDGEKEKKDEYPSINGKIAQYVYYQAINDQINGETNVYADLIDYKNKLKNYIIVLSRYANYIESNYGTSLTSKQIEDLEKIKKSYLDFARDKFQIEIILDCGTLIGEDFIEQIEKFANILKIVIPILLIGFGILDFTKAIFEQDDDKLKKAQKKFLMRILIAVLFFLLPVLVKLLLNIANNVWSFISPNTCDIKW